MTLMPRLLYLSKHELKFMVFKKYLKAQPTSIPESRVLGSSFLYATLKFEPYQRLRELVINIATM